MLGTPTAYDRIPYFFSDQYDVGMEYSGYATEWDDVIFRGDVASREFIAFWLKDGRVAAGMNVNVWDVADIIAELVAPRRDRRGTPHRYGGGARQLAQHNHRQRERDADGDLLSDCAHLPPATNGIGALGMMNEVKSGVSLPHR